MLPHFPKPEELWAAMVEVANPFQADPTKCNSLTLSPAQLKLALALLTYNAASKTVRVTHYEGAAPISGHGVMRGGDEH